MSVTNSGVQIVCNATLQAFGGDLYVGVMTIINSVREIASVPVNGSPVPPNLLWGITTAPKSTGACAAA